jgi:hypothetical protein
MPGEARFPTTRVCQAPVGSYSSNVLLSLSLSPEHVTLLPEIVGVKPIGVIARDLSR